MVYQKMNKDTTHTGKAEPDTAVTPEFEKGLLRFIEDQQLGLVGLRNEQLIILHPAAPAQVCAE